ncbi:MAG: hypothetical protein H6Q86_1399 [candidate division NC10 bacterium]|jgi:hypothetical protein|nr:hypothetical protein [candidate division NC10 bacterium]
MGCALVIIARDRPDLWMTWAAFYGGAATVEVLVDRRQGLPCPKRADRPDRRAHLNRESELQDRGFLVIPRTERG